MGLLDSILGSTRLPEARTDRLFAMATAAVTLESSLGLAPDGAAAVCIKPVESSGYEAARSEIEEILEIGFKETGTAHSTERDEYGYLWVVLRDPDFEDLVAAVQMICQILIEQGLGTQLLSAVYRFRGKGVVYWIYSFKLGSYYPFVPVGSQQRDTAQEFRLSSLMKKELPIEADETRWYPMWGMPV